MNIKSLLCLFIFIMTFVSLGCTETIYKTEIKYIKPDIPEAIISPCETVSINGIKTNGDLLMSYISLQSAYLICSSKINSIRLILESYDGIYDKSTNDSLDRLDNLSTDKDKEETNK